MNLKGINKILIEAHHEIAMEGIKSLKEENRKLKLENERLLDIIESLTKKLRNDKTRIER